MNRMADGILRGELHYPFWDREKRSARMGAKDLEEFGTRKLQEATVIEASNVCEFFYAQTDKEIWALTDFPNLAPAFPMFWIEMQRPSKILAGKVEAMGSGGVLPFRVGFLFEAFPANQAWKLVTARKGIEPLPIPTNPAFLDELKQEPRLYDLLLPAIAFAESSDKDAWFYEVQMYMEIARGFTMGPMVSFLLFVNRDGKAICQTAPFPFFLKEGDIEPSLQSYLRFISGPALLTICFLHCKNVRRNEHSLPNRVCKKYQRRYGVEPVKYKVLEIAPMREILRRDGGTGDRAGLQRALHICRGHFQSYQDKALFGKYKGTFWVPMHLRGKPDAGLIAKDYKIKLPTAI